MDGGCAATVPLGLARRHTPPLAMKASIADRLHLWVARCVGIEIAGRCLPQSGQVRRLGSISDRLFRIGSGQPQP